MVSARERFGRVFLYCRPADTVGVRFAAGASGRVLGEAARNGANKGCRAVARTSCEVCGDGRLGPGGVQFTQAARMDPQDRVGSVRSGRAAEQDLGHEAVGIDPRGVAGGVARKGSAVPAAGPVELSRSGEDRSRALSTAAAMVAGAGSSTVSSSWRWARSAIARPDCGIHGAVSACRGACRSAMAVAKATDAELSMSGCMDSWERELENVAVAAAMRQGLPAELAYPAQDGDAVAAGLTWPVLGRAGGIPAPGVVLDGDAQQQRVPVRLRADAGGGAGAWRWALSSNSFRAQAACPASVPPWASRTRSWTAWQESETVRSSSVVCRSSRTMADMAWRLPAIRRQGRAWSRGSGRRRTC